MTVPSHWRRGVIRLIPKAAASADPQLPSNFRPIALTSCIGKLYTSLLKNRWLQFMTANNFLDTSAQKAFLPGIPGCLEQYQKLIQSSMMHATSTGHYSSACAGWIWRMHMVVCIIISSHTVFSTTMPLKPSFQPSLISTQISAQQLPHTNGAPSHSTLESTRETLSLSSYSTQ